VQRRVRGPPGRQRGDREQGQDGQFGEPQVVLLELVQVEIPEVVHHRLDRGDERRPGVLAPVDQQREAADGQLHHDLPHHEGHGRNGPGQVVTSGPHRAQAPDGADDFDHAHGGHRDQHRFPGQHAVRQEQPGQQRPARADGEQPAEQARRGQRLGRIPGHAGDQAEVGRKDQPGQRMPAALPGEHPAEIAHDPDGHDVDHHEHDRDQDMLAKGDQPGQPGITNPHVPVRLVDPDAVRDVAEVDRVQRQPVEELAVVAVGRRHRYAGRQLRRRRDEMPPDQDEPADVALRPVLPASQHEGQSGQHGDQARDDGPVGALQQRPEPSAVAVSRCIGVGDDELLTRHCPFLRGGRARPRHTAELCWRDCSARESPVPVRNLGLRCEFPVKPVSPR
jgi:hypothetical protein